MKIATVRSFQEPSPPRPAAAHYLDFVSKSPSSSTPAGDSGCLIDGSAPARPDDLFQRLDALGVRYETHRHDPVFTVEEARRIRGRLPGCHTKNLFLRDKKEHMWLFVCEQDRAVDLKVVAALVGAKRLSFGSSARLMHYLGVIPGAVSPFAIVNDKNRLVRIVLDDAILDDELLNFHPLDNGMTTAIGSADFLTFLDAEEHSPLIVGLPA
jgi:Ala-tRNA(Pro) deacylase